MDGVAAPEAVREAVLADRSSTGDILFWGGVLIAGIGALGLCLWWIRRWSLSTHPRRRDEEDWSLQHLRDLRVRGDLSEAEFEALKDRMLARHRDEASRESGT
ncbi:MAG: SHOCT domain-containing protein [Phycisphaerae bacterium]